MADNKRATRRQGYWLEAMLFSILLLFVATNAIQASYASPSISASQTHPSRILDTPTATPTSTPQWDCPAPAVNPTFLLVPYSGGNYTIQVDVGANCNWRLDAWSSWLQYYCFGSGTGPGLINCTFSNPNPTGTLRQGQMSACTSENDYGLCTGITVWWEGPPTPTFQPTDTPIITSTRTQTLTPTPTITGTYPTSTNTPTITESPIATFTNTPNPLGFVRVDCGGPGGVDSQGNFWSADFGYIAGETYSTTEPIANTPDQFIYETERYGLNSYNFSVPNGFYTVRLHFAEIFSDIQGPGGRVFSTSVNGTYLYDFDQYAETGGLYRALIKTFLIEVTNG